jgi:hypothetical protein
MEDMVGKLDTWSSSWSSSSLPCDTPKPEGVEKLGEEKPKPPEMGAESSELESSNGSAKGSSSSSDFDDDDAWLSALWAGSAGGLEENGFHIAATGGKQPNKGQAAPNQRCVVLASLQTTSTAFNAAV